MMRLAYNVHSKRRESFPLLLGLFELVHHNVYQHLVSKQLDFECIRCSIAGWFLRSSLFLNWLDQTFLIIFHVVRGDELALDVVD